MLKILFFLYFLILTTCSDNTPARRDSTNRKQMDQKVSVCNRTEEIKKAILEEIEEVDKTECSKVTNEHLHKIIGLKIITETTIQFQSHDLQDLVNLKELAISFNTINTFPDGFFDEPTQLQQLALNDNQLKHLPPQLFSKLTQLQQLSLDNNKLKTLPPQLFSKLVSLKKLSLKNNLFSEEEKSRIKKELENRTDLSIEI